MTNDEDYPMGLCGLCIYIYSVCVCARARARARVRACVRVCVTVDQPETIKVEK